MWWVCLICFLLLCTGGWMIADFRAGELVEALMRFGRTSTLQDDLNILTGTPAKGFFRQDYELKEMLKSTGREGRYETVKYLSLVLFAAGAVSALLLRNTFLVPVLGTGFALIPLWYLRSTAAAYKRHLNEELETAISVVTTSYLRTEDIIRAVKENLSGMGQPVKAAFESFLYETEMINANIPNAVNMMKLRVKNRVFHEWCDMLIQCQASRDMKHTLPAVVQKFSDVRIVQSELDTMMQEPRREAVTMVILVIANVPLLYFLNRDWFSVLLFTVPGKITLTVCAAIILYAAARILQLGRPIEYGE